MFYEFVIKRNRAFPSIFGYGCPIARSPTIHLQFKYCRDAYKILKTTKEINTNTTWSTWSWEKTIKITQLSFMNRPVARNILFNLSPRDIVIMHQHALLIQTAEEVEELQRLHDDCDIRFFLTSRHAHYEIHSNMFPAYIKQQREKQKQKQHRARRQKRQQKLEDGKDYRTPLPFGWQYKNKSLDDFSIEHSSYERQLGRLIVGLRDEYALPFASIKRYLVSKGIHSLRHPLSRREAKHDKEAEREKPISKDSLTGSIAKYYEITKNGFRVL